MLRRLRKQSRSVAEQQKRKFDMTSVLPENATDWRELSDDPDTHAGRQVGRRKLSVTVGEMWAPRGQLDNKAAYVAYTASEETFEMTTSTTTTKPLSDVRLPAGADDVDEWADPDTSAAYRVFQACRHVIPAVPADRHGSRPWSEDIEVCVSGTQNGDGRIERQIIVNQLHPDNPITIEQARQLAAALLEATRAAEAADEIDGLAPTRTGSP